MDTAVRPVARLEGRIRVSPDKSITHRALILGALADGRTVIRNPLPGEDCLSTARCLAALGVHVRFDRDPWTVEGAGLGGWKRPAGVLDCGNSGTTMRLLTGALAAHGFESELSGDASLVRRPMKRVADPLSAMGAEVVLHDGRYPPVKVRGRADLRPARWSNPVASAQVKSAVLLAALHAKGETVYEEPFLSRDHTERMLAALGVPLERRGASIRLNGPARLAAAEWIVPGDFSSAAFFLVAGAILPDADLVLEDVNLNPTRTGLLRVLKNMGADITVEEEGDGAEPRGTLRVRGGKPLRPPVLSAEDVPTLIDEIPALAVAAAKAEGVTRLSGLEELRVKETDRIAALASDLGALGAEVVETKDGLEIRGPATFRGAAVESYGDHRIAMAMAVAGLAATGEVTVKDSECVAVSFPAFWNTLEAVAR